MHACKKFAYCYIRPQLAAVFSMVAYNHMHVFSMMVVYNHRGIYVPDLMFIGYESVCGLVVVTPKEFSNQK